MITATTATTTAPTTALNTSSSAEMDKNQFLKLLMTQLQHQDPMNPMDDKEFMGQMAQFSTLEQITNLVQAETSIGFGSQVSQATSLIGHEITWENADGTTGSGVPTKVSIDGSKITLHVGDSTEIDPGQVRTIGEVPAASATGVPPATSSTGVPPATSSTGGSGQ